MRDMTLYSLPTGLSSCHKLPQTLHLIVVRRPCACFVLLWYLQVPADVQLPAQVRVWWLDVAVLCQQGAGLLCSHGSIYRVRPLGEGGGHTGKADSMYVSQARMFVWSAVQLWHGCICPFRRYKAPACQHWALVTIHPPLGKLGDIMMLMCDAALQVCADHQAGLCAGCPDLAVWHRVNHLLCWVRGHTEYMGLRKAEGGGAQSFWSLRCRASNFQSLLSLHVWCARLVISTQRMAAVLTFCCWCAGVLVYFLCPPAVT